ncbi:MAG: non-canonical purine NTP pyrophosphatase [Bacilli bacterium]|nr:non-canonical purine NTP pyrophosphatase [Bacilli bacterium]
MKKILFATGNEAKVKRFYDSLAKKDIEMISLKDIDIDLDVEENGKDAIENALIKARAYSNIVDFAILAMDDTLYLENVPEDLQPGMYVRRVNGKRLDDNEMIEHYSNLAKVYGNDGKLTAKWVYGMALIFEGKEYTYTWNKEEFYIVDTPTNIINPGYPLNSISVHKKLNKYFTDITDEDKILIKEDETHVIDFIINSMK